MITNFGISEHAERLGLPLVGIYNKDELHQQPVENGFYVINLQDSVDTKGNPLSGSHWTCFLIEHHEACYFDSFGIQPPEEVKHYLKDFIPFCYNTLTIQNPQSGVCGYYVLAYMIFMVENHKKYKHLKDRLSAFTSMFDTDVEKNKKILESYIKPY
jgi:hypothetical protein